MQTVSSLKETDWNSDEVVKKLLDLAIKSSFHESTIETIIECEQTFKLNSDSFSHSEKRYA